MSLPTDFDVNYVDEHQNCQEGGQCDNQLDFVCPMAHETFWIIVMLKQNENVNNFNDVNNVNYVKYVNYVNCLKIGM